MTIRVVLYAEGGGETGGEARLPPTPGAVLDESELGVGHVLVARALEKVRNIPIAAVRFEGPSATRAAR